MRGADVAGEVAAMRDSEEARDDDAQQDNDQRGDAEDQRVVRLWRTVAAAGLLLASKRKSEQQRHLHRVHVVRHNQIKPNQI